MRPELSRTAWLKAHRQVMQWNNKVDIHVRLRVRGLRFVWHLLHLNSSIMGSARKCARITDQTAWINWTITGRGEGNVQGDAKAKPAKGQGEKQ
jgi:hypothetical protein